MRTRSKTLGASPNTPRSLLQFLKEKTGASMYEFALLASLVAVVGIIVLIALTLEW